ncbi:MAG TPA: sugar phosphate isomerase/epimerase [Candidatus Cottocaccamicrobium excrementipullorum]|nr:sugar phosphate isomerase/epimerase [Candidatus Cottocaccamicrobium excrementipullorum]
MMIQFGMRAHDFCKPGKMEEVFAGLHQAGIRHIQLAMEKSISDYDFAYGNYSAGLGRFIGEKLKENDLHVAVLGCYINPVIPDEERRMAEVNRFIERLRYAKRMDADMVGTETGRYSLDMSVTPLTESKECYRLLLDSFTRIAEAAEALGVVVGVEGVFDHTLSSPEKMKQFLDDIASPSFEVILDAANLIAPWTTKPETQNEIIDKAFSLYGDRISVLHLKDCVFDENGVQVCTRPGEGLIVYDSLMKHLRSQKKQIIGLLEESDPEHFKSDCDFFAGLCRE